jgi:hypothetical protein
MISRKNYLEKLIANKDHKIIKVVTGVRRCGKSTLFRLYIDYLKSIGIQDHQIIAINLEDIDNEELLDYKKLYNYVKERLCKDQITYIFIDEVQNCKNFEKAVDSLFIKEDTDVYITGSNAYMLSGELATLLSGRYITIDMLPLSFREYYEANQDTENSKKELFNDYMKWGSFPYLATIEKNPNIIHPYIEGIYNTILIKDIAKREGITDVSLIESIIKVLMGSVGSPISIKKISDTLNASGRKISVNTVASYMNALTDSYLFYKVDRYDIKGRQFLKTLGKYYHVDMGIRNLLLSGYSTDLGHVIENITYLELLRRGNKVSIGKLAENEIDFVAVNSDEIIYYQVAATVLDVTTLQRELRPLNRIPDHHRKLLLSLDEIGCLQIMKEYAI